MKNLNIDRNNNFIIADDKKYMRNDLIKNTIAEFTKSGLKNIKLEFNDKQFFLKCNFEGKYLSFDMFLKNITGAGWKDKINMKRCQVSNIKNTNPEKTIIIKDNHYNLIIGYYNFDNNPIFVAWDPYRYLNHKTIRSCYVTVDALKRGYEKKYYECVVSSQKCWIFLGEKFKEFIDNYTSYVSNFYLKGE